MGATTFTGSLQSVREPGVVCMTGMVGDRWSIAGFAPMHVIPTAVSLTTYAGDVTDFMAMPFQELVEQVATASIHVPVGRVFRLDDIVQAHRTMEDNRAGGKIVVPTR